MKFAVFLILFMRLPAVFAQDDRDYRLFLDRQWRALKYQTSKPSPRFVLPLSERTWLNASFEPVERGKRIGRRYFEIAQELSRCLSPKGKMVGNWYHFAAWASDSANEVINGKKFDPQTNYVRYFKGAYHAGRISKKDLLIDIKIDQAFQAANSIIQKSGIDETDFFENYELQQKQIFADTNYAIAAEMIPVGEAFLETFCSSKGSGMNDSAKANAFFNGFESSELPLKKSFLHYREALLEKDKKKKIEKILLASVEQVFHEQTRVQKNLKKSLDLAPRALTLSAGFFFGNQAIRLHRDIRVVTMASELKSIENSSLKAIFKGLGLEAGDPGARIRGSACKNWSILSCRKRFLAPLFRELLIGEPELYEFSK
jgi:hypothetical protein